jgi:hypothetical protein
MIVYKEIKPAKLKVDAFRLEALSALHRAERGIKADFMATQKTWEDEDKATFASIISLTQPGPTVVVEPDQNADIWTMVNNGTPEHDIPLKPKTLGFLAFQVGYKAKTSPGVIGSKAGGKHGPYARKKQVHHPGFEARHFDKAIAEKWQKPFKRMMEDAMKSAAIKSGHGVK